MTPQQPQARTALQRLNLVMPVRWHIMAVQHWKTKAAALHQYHKDCSLCPQQWLLSQPADLDIELPVWQLRLLVGCHGALHDSAGLQHQ